MRRSDQPLPGDIVIRQRLDKTSVRPSVAFALLHWPQDDVLAGGPYQSYAYAHQQAIRLAAATRAHVWRHHVNATGDEQFEDVTGDYAPLR